MSEDREEKTCRTCGQPYSGPDCPDGIGHYYAWVRARSERAWAKYREAEARGDVDPMELHRLREAAIDAGDTGD